MSSNSDFCPTSNPKLSVCLLAGWVVWFFSGLFVFWSVRWLFVVIGWLVFQLVDCLFGLFVGCLVFRFVGCLFCLLFVWFFLVDCLFHLFVGCLVFRLVGWSVYWLLFCFFWLVVLSVCLLVVCFFWLVGWSVSWLVCVLVGWISDKSKVHWNVKPERWNVGKKTPVELLRASLLLVLMFLFSSELL